jgi:hypothetical protein
VAGTANVVSVSSTVRFSVGKQPFRSSEPPHKTKSAGDDEETRNYGNDVARPDIFKDCRIMFHDAIVCFVQVALEGVNNQMVNADASIPKKGSIEAEKGP